MERVRDRTFSVLIDYALTLSQMIDEARFENVTLDPSWFTVDGHRIVRIRCRYVEYLPDENADDVIKRMASIGLRPAKIAELVSFAAAYPNEQRKFFIIALGDVLGRDLPNEAQVPCLFGSPRWRNLLMIWLGWHPESGQLLAVKTN
jgi:hypothetical protein